MMGKPSFAVVSVLVALSCGRTGLDSDLVDALGSGGLGNGGRGGRGAGGSLSGGQGGSAASGGNEIGGASGTTGGGGAVGGSQGGALGGGNGGAGGVGASSATGGVSSGGTGGAGASGMGGTAGLAGMAGMPSISCGDGIVGPDESCDGGREPSPPALELRQGDARYEILPIVGPNSPTAFYDYRSASSHTGFEAVGASRIYIYRWTLEQAASLVFHHGIDEDATGLVQPEAHVIFEVSGLPTTGVVVLSDERAEFARTSGTAAGAEWEFRQNTDGGIVGGLPFPGSWHLVVNAQFLLGFYEWTFLSGSGVADTGILASHLLDMSQPIEIVSNSEPGGCRADCTVPTCGDGRLDPGEVCDDGNDASGDGCSACFPEL